MIAAYGFQKRWRAKLASGKKRMTIRARRKDGRVPKAGDTFRGYVGMRTKQCELVVEGVVARVKCVGMLRSSKGVRVFIEGVELSPRRALKLAQADGFESYADFLTWFLPPRRWRFQGHIIEWRAA